MPVAHESSSAMETAACRASATPCAACRKAGGAPVDASAIHSYGSAPRGGWTPRRDPNGSPTAPTFGVELEFQRGPARGSAALTGEELVATASPRGFWHSQHDGSVSGPEFASQPADLATWRANRAHIAAFMRTAVHGGWRSHDGLESCSMHVNIGGDAFADAAHLAKFIRLATMNPRWSTRLAQRRTSRSPHGPRSPVSQTTPRVAARCRVHEQRVRVHGHAAAVNLENHGRVEFRVPRGTLRVDRFMGKLEWVAAMVEYSRSASRVARRLLPVGHRLWRLPGVRDAAWRPHAGPGDRGDAGRRAREHLLREPFAERQPVHPLPRPLRRPPVGDGRLVVSASPAQGVPHPHKVSASARL
ncbi:MAG: hypothetical protein U0838_07965 [Chloroflexota bacterium]